MKEKRDPKVHGDGSGGCNTAKTTELLYSSAPLLLYSLLQFNQVGLTVYVQSAVGD